MAETRARQTARPDLRRVRRVVVKLGTQVLTDPSRGGVDPRFVDRIADQVAHLVHRRVAVTLVSSGSIGVGGGALGLSNRPRDIGVLQAAAAVGQSGLMHRWHEAFKRYGLSVAQMLLTRDDFEDRHRYLNIRNCLAELHRLRAIPVVNENDTVSVDEIRFGDNDILAGLVANALSADALFLLTTVDGLKARDGRTVETVHDIADARRHVLADASPLGTGGMDTKLEAARIVTEAGEAAVIADGREPDIVRRLVDGERTGTVVLPARPKMASRQRWIGMTVRPSGSIDLDEGAAAAVRRRGKSLLATGITGVRGRFKKGDVVTVRGPDGRELGRGLTNYPAEEARAIQGKRSDQFEKILGHAAYTEVVHRNNLVLTHHG